MISTAEDRRYGRHSSPHPGELRLVAGGAAYPGETVVLYTTTPRPERTEVARYIVQRLDHWRAPDLCSGTSYYAVIVPEPREVVPLEWDHVLGPVRS